MSVLDVVAFLGLEVGVEATLVIAHGEVSVPRIHIFVDTGTCRIFPFGICGQSVRLDIHTFLAQGAAQVVGTPVTEGVGLFPADAHHGIVRVSAVSKVHAHVWLIVGIFEVIYPRRGVRIDVDNISVQEVIVAGESAGDGLAYNLTLIVEVCRVLGDDRHISRRRHIGIVYAASGVQAYFALAASVWLYIS